VASRIKTLYAQYWLTGQSLQLTRENIELTRHLEQIAQARYAGGLAAQQDAIRAQLERSAMDAELVGMESEFHHLMVFVNAMLARPSRAALAEPASLRAIPARLDGAALNARLLAANPQLAIEAARVGGAEKSRELAYRNRYPDFTVGVAPMQVGSRVDAWSLMLEMNLPLQQGTRRSQERESERMLEAAAARQEALGHRLMGELNAALNNLDGARSTEQITRTRLLPQAELTFKSALAGYENGKVDFATLLDAQRQIRNAKLALLRAQASQQMRLAEIERLLGEDL
jgi:outer membrane protein TolC